MMKDRRVTRALRLLSVLALVALLFALATASALARAAAPRPAAATTSFRATIKDGRAAAQALLAQSGAASFSLALVSGERVVWQETFGDADKATSTPPTADTMYGIGSVSKMLATVAAMTLVDQGKVELDAPFARYVPAFTMLAPAYRQITVRMLLDHSSGFPGSTYSDLVTATYFPGYLQQVLDTLAIERLKTTPGYMSVYCNDGFTMIEALVFAVTGKTYAQYVQDEIFTPLGMDHSAYPLEPFPDGSYAKAYTGDVANPREVLNMLASGGLYSTPSDMSRLARMLMNGGAYGDTRVLTAASVAEMGTDQTLLSFNQRLAILAGIAKSKVTKQGDRVRAVEVYSKLAGDQPPEREELTVKNAQGEAFTVTARGPTKLEKIAALAAQRKARAQPVT